ncbi:DUF7033 domain-containing protein [Pedobacter heparinus]|uniref:DUF7033 domain-containing protein n=1 Tax=Pedobacter heparinus TaxID=984 RepID=UPI00292E4DB5|nr:hypothetical protein [Pedobacter heparinus]
MKLLAYVPLLTPRIKYIFSFIFNDVLKTEIGFTVNIREFVDSGLPKFCYAAQPIGGELFFKSTNLLLEHKISDQDIKTSIFGELKVPFAVQKSTLPFDVFAASFYFLSRYEEYLSQGSQKDQPYAAENSLQYQLGLLKLPVIDEWALILKNILLKQFPALTFGQKYFSFEPLHAAYPAARNNSRNLLANALDYFRSILQDKTSKHAEKMAGIQQVSSSLQSGSLLENPIRFIPSPDHQHHFDTVMLMPKSYVKLTKNNTINDYSMYYKDKPGFRAGTCSPFPWYDLQLDKKTQLTVHPIAATDQVLLRNKSTEALLVQLHELLDHVKLVNGHFYLLSLGNDIRPQ